LVFFSKACLQCDLLGLGFATDAIKLGGRSGLDLEAAGLELGKAFFESSNLAGSMV
jgi:hypothetical protein